MDPGSVCCNGDINPIVDEHTTRGVSRLFNRLAYERRQSLTFKSRFTYLDEIDS